MDIKHRRLPRVDVLSVSGRVQAPEAAQLREHIDRLFNEGRYRLVLDLEQLESIGSSGLYVLIQIHKRVLDEKVTRRGRGAIRIIHVRPHIRQILKLTGLTSLFHVCEEREEAVHSLSGCGDRKLSRNVQGSSGTVAGEH